MLNRREWARRGRVNRAKADVVPIWPPVRFQIIHLVIPGSQPRTLANETSIGVRSL
jgi:hypothetical protein